MGVESVLEYLGGGLYPLMKKADNLFLENMEEIRLRVDKPLMLYAKNQEYTLSIDGRINQEFENGYKITGEDITKTIALMSDFSLYALEDELRNGYLTLPGGHRVGIAGKAVVEKGAVKTISHISGLNIRLSHEVFGCGDKVMPYIVKPKLAHTMIISPPSCGKTTLLRDIVRQISNGVPGLFSGCTVAVADERSEIAGCYMGVAQNDVGFRTDVLDACPKAVGMTMLLRSMAPKAIAVDEIGSRADIAAIEDVINAGVKIICTVHGGSMEEIRQKPALGPLMDKGIFQRYILLGYKDKPGHVKGVYDKDFRLAVAYDH